MKLPQKQKPPTHSHQQTFRSLAKSCKQTRKETAIGSDQLPSSERVKNWYQPPFLMTRYPRHLQADMEFKVSRLQVGVERF